MQGQQDTEIYANQQQPHTATGTEAESNIRKSKEKYSNLGLLLLSADSLFESHWL